jgi:lipopolysaccharide biosynthesis glycosyltransferase
MMHLVKEIKDVNNYELVLLFNNNEIRKINFEPKLKEWTTSPQSKFGQLLNLNIFNTVKLDEEMETIVWGNGIDLCPNVLYEMSEPV